MGDICQDLRRQVSAAIILGESRNMGGRPIRQRIGDLRTNSI